jgi:ketosteroid isomerase-like protein
MKAGPDTIDWLRSYYEAVDQLRFDKVAQFLHEDCENQYPVGIVVSGREKILRGMRVALEALAGTDHQLKAAWEEEGELIFELDVTYRRRDGQTIVRPGVGIFTMEDGKIRRQRLFVDAAGVWE